MTSGYPKDWYGYLSVLIVFLRLLGLFLMTPGFSNQVIPVKVKLILGLVLSLALFPLVASRVGALPSSIGGLALVAFRETAIGFLMGFAAYLTFEALALASQFMGTQMGFGVAGMVDPGNHSQASILVPLQGWLVLMVFLFTDMHHMMIRLFILSFEATRVSQTDLIVSPALFKTVTVISSKLFLLAVQMSAPFTLLVLASNLAIGILSRLLPQMNILLFSFPITILLGISALYIFAPEMLDYFERALGDMTGDVVGILKTL